VPAAAKNGHTDGAILENPSGPAVDVRILTNDWNLRTGCRRKEHEGKNRADHTAHSNAP
jgi:hypothetical protein